LKVAGTVLSRSRPDRMAGTAVSVLPDREYALASQVAPFAKAWKFGNFARSMLCSGTNNIDCGAKSDSRRSTSTRAETISINLSVFSVSNFWF